MAAFAVPPNYVPVQSTTELDALDEGERTEGYRDGFAGWPCGDNRSRAYQHGWVCARADKAGVTPDFLRRLAREMAAKQRKEN